MGEEDQQTPLLTNPPSCSSSNELDEPFKTTGMDITTLPTPSSGSQRQTREKVNWTEDMKQCFLNLLIEQVQAGRKTEGGFRTKAWNTMTGRINTLQNMDLRKENLQNKYKVWKKDYNIVKKLRNQPGFGWNEERQMVVADDLVWNDYLKRHKVTGIAKFRGQPFPYYEELKTIVGDDPAEGHTALAFGEIDGMRVNSKDNHAHLSNNGSDSSAPPRTHPSKSNTASEPRTKKKKTIHNTMDIIAKSMVKVGDALEKISMQQDSHIEPLYEALMAIPGMSHEDPVFIAAYEYYADEKVKATAFLRLPEEARASYIYKKFGTGSTD